ncbi:phytanoyl-CoA dioxygenase family protein [Dinoroseobacter sp. S124A]|uniref:phytanoyl-CoA dioxygenase family protein n=1 Tax=Dinoroseobacter sp. S124A TaxID=3415128 RepID=UPI003C7BA67F
MLDTSPDLSFAPVRNPNPATLTPEQIDRYNRDGYLTGLRAFPPSQAEANRTTFDGLLAGLGRDGAYAINCYQARAQAIWDLCTAPAILDVVEDLVGPNIVCWASHFFCKLPGDPKHVPWHQDAAFWHLAPARTVTVWLAIDDTDAENAAMQFIPRSHDKGALDWRASEGGVLNKELVDTASLGAPVTNALRAGEMSVHADMLAHGSAANLSNRRRCGLTIRYCPPEVRMTDAAWAQGIEAILCRGNDPSGHWRHHARPRGNDVSPENSPRNLGGN